MRDRLFFGASGKAKTNALLQKMDYEVVINLGPDRIYHLNHHT